MMNVEEIEGVLKQEKQKLVKLEEAYEKEEDENKISKLEYSISRKEENLDKLIERQQKLLDKETEDGKKEDPKDKNAEEEDLDVCESCGGNLVMVGVDDNNIPVFECENCKELYLDE